MRMEYWWNDADIGKPKYSERNLSQPHFVQHLSTWNGLVLNPHFVVRGLSHEILKPEINIYSFLKFILYVTVNRCTLQRPLR
jgi:hypothetical protein